MAAPADTILVEAPPVKIGVDGLVPLGPLPEPAGLVPLGNEQTKFAHVRRVVLLV